LPDEWQLVVAGDGPEREAILAQAQALGIEHRVHLPGFAEPAKIAALFDLFVLSSLSEQFPIAVVEAMAAGLPVAAPAVGDVSAIVAPENLPFVVAPGDEAALGQAMARLAGDAGLRAAVGRANRAKALAEFDEGRMIERFRALYWGAIERRAY
jgi:glycosyltransferase involved in cell wall biosynthesis